MTGEEAVLINEVIEKVCKKCKFYNRLLELCRGEVLPVWRAIEKNAEGRGLCDDVKNYLKEGKDECKTESEDI